MSIVVSYDGGSTWVTAYDIGSDAYVSTKGDVVASYTREGGEQSVLVSEQQNAPWEAINIANDTFLPERISSAFPIIPVVPPNDEGTRTIAFYRKGNCEDFRYEVHIVKGEVNGRIDQQYTTLLTDLGRDGGVITPTVETCFYCVIYDTSTNSFAMDTEDFSFVITEVYPTQIAIPDGADIPAWYRWGLYGVNPTNADQFNDTDICMMWPGWELYGDPPERIYLGAYSVNISAQLRGYPCRPARFTVINERYRDQSSYE